MGVKAELVGSQVTIYVEGIFDINLYDAFNNAYKTYLDQAKSFVIDFRHTSNIDSAALGLMLLLRQKAGADEADVSIINANDSVMKVLNIAQFGQLFQVR